MKLSDDAKTKKEVLGALIAGVPMALYGAFRIGCQHGVDVTHDAIKNVCDKETFEKVDAALTKR